MHRSPSPRKLFLPGLLTAVMLGAPGRLLGQQDSATMQPDTSMMSHDSAMGSGQKTDLDQKMDHGKMMSHDSAMAPNLMFMGSGSYQATGDYEMVEAQGKRQIRFTNDFSVSAAPELHVVLAAGASADGNALDLGKLKRRQGAQTYELPRAADLSRYHTLLIWSRALSRPVASAELHAAGGHMEHQ